MTVDASLLPAAPARLPTAAARRRVFGLGLALGLLALALLVLGVAVGSTGIDSLAAMRDDPVAWRIVWDIRLPRTAGAWVTGALLGLAGAVAQGLFRNPLADPYLLGSGSGASLGAALALLAAGRPAGADWWLQIGITGAAFVGAVVAVVLTLGLARGAHHTLRLLLGGVIVGVVLGAAKDLVTVAAPGILESMHGFTLGTTSFLGWQAVTMMTAVLLACVVAAWWLAPVLDGLTLGEATAASLSLALPGLRAALVAVLALATATAVAQAGMIAFVGLAAPHLVRPLVRSTHAPLLLLSAAMVGALLMVADLLARWLLAPQELPVGVLTALIGGGYLLWLMHRRGLSGGSR